MSKRTVLVTGAGSGFGKGAAVELAARGHAVVATTETAEQANALRAEHPTLTTMKLDVTSAEDIEQVADLEIDVSSTMPAWVSWAHSPRCRWRRSGPSSK